MSHPYSGEYHEDAQMEGGKVKPELVSEINTELLEALKEEHRKVVSEFSGNFGGHVSIREGWVMFDEETPIEKCNTCNIIAKAEWRA